MAQLTISADAEFAGATATGRITADVMVAPGETILAPEGCFIRGVVFEDDVDWCCGIGGISSWDHVARLVTPSVVLTATNSGEQQQAVLDFPLDPSWDVSNLRAIAFVQRDANRFILNSAATTTTVTGSLPSLPAGRFVLEQNRPNPFRSSTVVAFELGRPGPVRLDIFDVGGRRVARLVDTVLGAGPHSTRWSGLDRTGSPVPSGVYFYRLSTETDVVTREMVLRR